MMASSAGGLGGLAQPQGHHARGGAEVVEFPAAGQRGAGEEPLQHVVPDGVETVDAGANPDDDASAASPAGGRFEQDLQITRADDADVYRRGSRLSRAGNR